MNKRARNRLIIAAAIIVVVGAAGFMLAMGDSQEIKSVSALLKDPGKIVGTRIKVTGLVIGESWDGKTNPMRFEIRDDATGTTEPATLKVEYSGVAPGGFGDKTKATLTGELGRDGVFKATDMLTVCPTKYQTKQVMSVDQLLADKAIVDQTVGLAGYVTGPATSNVFEISSRVDGGGKVEVKAAGTLPAGIGKGAFVELTGELLLDGTFRASKVDVKKKAD
jgi:cytochrome c-type biogenesis protein CcmE